MKNETTREAAARQVPTTMQAWTRTEYGTARVLSMTEEPVPTPGDGEVLVEVRATSANAADWHLLTGEPRLVRLTDGIRRPKSNRTGLDLAGTVVAIGGDVTQWNIGDRVFGEVHGAFAGFAVAKEGAVARIPDDASFEQAAAIPVAGLTAIQAVRDKAGVEQGQDVLVIGASGGVGTYVVQIAKAMGARVTAVASTRNLEMVERLGADRVIDRTIGDFTQSGERFDVVIDVAGLRKFSDARRLLADQGTYVLIGGPKKTWLGPMRYLVRALLAGIGSKQTFKGMLAKVTQADLEILGGMLGDGTITPEISEVYEWDRLPEAVAHLGEGHARAKLVVRR